MAFPLHAAARKGDVAEVRRLLGAGASVDGVDEDGASPLHLAAYRGRVAAVRVLLAHGARPNLRTRYNFIPRNATPLYLAALFAPNFTKWDPELLGALLSAGADPEIPGGDENLTPVQWLRGDGRDEWAEELERLIAAHAAETAVAPPKAPSLAPSSSASGSGGTTGGPQKVNGGARQLSGVDPNPSYTPIRDYVKTVKPSGTAREVFLNEVVPAFPSMNGRGEWLCKEAAKVATSVMDNGDNGPLSPQLVFTLVLYTLDVRPAGGKPEENFYYAFNSALQKRDAKVLEKIQGYLHFFMRALDVLPAEPEQVFFRGIPKEAFAVKDAYKNGRRIHWSGITSVSEDEAVSREFALEGGAIEGDGPGGILFRITARCGRKIAHLSPIAEKEVLLPPNFCGIVTKKLYRDHDVWAIDIMEADDEGTYVF